VWSKPATALLPPAWNTSEFLGNAIDISVLPEWIFTPLWNLTDILGNQLGETNIDTALTRGVSVIYILTSNGVDLGAIPAQVFFRFFLINFIINLFCSY
jgi:hypothetical protein